MNTNPYRNKPALDPVNAPRRPFQVSDLTIVGVVFWTLSVLQFVHALMHGQTDAFALTLPFLAVILVPWAIWKGHGPRGDEARNLPPPRTGAE